MDTQGNPVLCNAGRVVSKSAATDSLIFSIKNDDRIKVMEELLAENSGLGDDAFNLPDDEGILENGALLIGFGAQRRGVVPLKSILKAHSLLGGADEAATPRESHQSNPGKMDFFESHNILHIEDVTFETTSDFSESHNLAHGEAVFE